jgi:hypothetical protein
MIKYLQIYFTKLINQYERLNADIRISSTKQTILIINYVK